MRRVGLVGMAQPVGRLNSSAGPMVGLSAVSEPVAPARAEMNILVDIGSRLRLPSGLSMTAYPSPTVLFAVSNVWLVRSVETYLLFGLDSRLPTPPMRNCSQGPMAVRLAISGRRPAPALLRQLVGGRAEAQILAQYQIAWASSVNTAATRRPGDTSSPGS
jgi:hypothetical protein